MPEIEFYELILFYYGVLTRQKAGAIAILNGAPVHMRAFLVEFNSRFCFLAGVEYNSQYNNGCVFEKLQYHFHVLAIVWKKDGMYHVSLGVLKRVYAFN